MFTHISVHYINPANFSLFCVHILRFSFTFKIRDNVQGIPFVVAYVHPFL